MCTTQFLSLLAGPILLFAVSTHGATYYVDSMSGRESNDGTTPETAWVGLTNVNSQVFLPGDQILFHSGSRYTGQLKPQGSGSPEQPIVIDRYGDGPLPRIDGEGAVFSTVFLHNVECWEVRNLEVTNEGDQPKWNRRGVHILNEELETARHLVLSNLYVHDVNGTLPKRREAGVAILAEIGRGKQLRFDGLTIENCHIENCGRDAIRIWGVCNREQWFPSLNVVIRENLIEKVGGDGIVPTGCDGALVEWNTMRDCVRLGKIAGPAAGIWPWSCDNTIIQFNEVSDHKAWVDAQGFDSDYNCENTLIQYNYSHDNEGGFVLICCPGKKSRNTDTVIRYNVSINDGFRKEGGRPYFSPTFHITGPVENSRIYNNIIIVPEKSDPALDRSLVTMDNWNGPWPVDTLFANNIFYVTGSADFEFGKDRNTIFQNNLYFGDIIALPKDSKAVFSNPAFVDPVLDGGESGFDILKGFMLQRGSPCIRAGKKMEKSGIIGFFGNSVPVGRAPCIGIHERPVDK